MQIDFYVIPIVAYVVNLIQTDALPGLDHKSIWNNGAFFQHNYAIFDRV